MLEAHGAQNRSVLNVREDSGLPRATTQASSEVELCRKSTHYYHLKDDPSLLEEVVGLVEYPVVLCGKIEDRFLDLPSEVLVSSMRTHQKYFSVFWNVVLQDREGQGFVGDTAEHFAPFFLFVSNIDSPDPNIVIKGNEKVLSARLSDALYFYHQDLKKPLEDANSKLDKVIFLTKLGSMKAEVDLVGKLLKLVDITSFIYSSLSFINPEEILKTAQEAALIYKSDLVSEMVGEFPDLQGIMGYYYALNAGRNKDVAEAVRDHYKPQGPSDSVPTGAAAVLALFDKMNSLCGLMLAGERATGSKDPKALRRLALGIIIIILENKLNQNIVEFIKSACNLRSSVINYSQDDVDQITSFIEERAKNYFKNKFDSKLVSAVIDFDREPKLLTMQLKLEALDRFLKSENGNALLNSYKRANNIIGNMQPKGVINEELFTQYDRELCEALSQNAKVIDDAIEEKISFALSLDTMALMKPVLANFFDNVMVMDKNPEIANNRLLLLDKTRKLFNKIANFDLL